MLELGETEALGDTEGEVDELGLLDDDGLTDGDTEALGLLDDDGETEGLTLLLDGKSQSCQPISHVGPLLAPPVTNDP